MNLFYSNIMAAFRGMHASPAKHSSAWLPRKCDYRTYRQTDGQTDRRQTKWSLCAATLCRQHNKTVNIKFMNLVFFYSLAKGHRNIKKHTTHFLNTVWKENSFHHHQCSFNTKYWKEDINFKNFVATLPYLFFFSFFLSLFLILFGLPTHPYVGLLRGTLYLVGLHPGPNLIYPINKVIAADKSIIYDSDLVACWVM